jgi:hypothetical protein
MSIWFLVIKCRESPWFTCVKEVCHMLLESFRQGLWFCCTPRLNQRSTQEIMSVKSGGLLIARIVGFLTWESWEKHHLHVAFMVCHKEYYKGRWWFPPSPKCDESFESVYACGSSLHQKCSNYALTSLLFNLCKSIWMIDLLFIHPNPHPKSPTRLSYPQSAMNQRAYPNSFFFHCFHFGTCIWVFQRVWGCAIQFLFPLATQSTCYSIFLKKNLWSFIFSKLFLQGHVLTIRILTIIKNLWTQI